MTLTTHRSSLLTLGAETLRGVRAILYECRRVVGRPIARCYFWLLLTSALRVACTLSPLSQGRTPEAAPLLLALAFSDAGACHYHTSASAVQHRPRTSILRSRPATIHQTLARSIRTTTTTRRTRTPRSLGGVGQQQEGRREGER